jgi:hypothetical protein
VTYQDIEALVDAYGRAAQADGWHDIDTDRTTHARDALLAAIAEVCRDSERYRWLRDFSIGQNKHPIVVSQSYQAERMLYVGPLCYAGLDAAIDAAMRDGT